MYLVKHDPLDEFSAKLSAVIDHDEIPVFDQVTGIQFSGSENYTVTGQEESPDTYCSDDVYFASKNEKPLPMDTQLVETYLRSIANLGLTDYASYNVTDEELRAYGLDQPDLTITVDYTPEEDGKEGTPETFVLHISRDPAAKAEEDAGSEENKEYAAYARVGESQIVYQICSDRYELLMDASCDALRHQELLSADSEDISQIGVSLEGKRYTFTPRGKGDEISWVYENEELETAGFLDALEALSVEEFTDERPAQKEEVRVTVFLNNERFPEAEITLYCYDGVRCLAEVNGESTALVERGSVVNFIEAVRSVVL
ncbi:MAG: DUF4340 domain-containing protein [Oscillibacter sp.]|nr:DUF4340 domain-containing protein [Oscillibacter sp.]